MSELPRDWLPSLIGLLEHEPAVVRILVTEVRGSAPRDAGAFMLIGRDCQLGTIGGGRLEWESIASARTMLTNPGATVRVQRTVLGADLGQCCGGVVWVWLERFTRADLGLLQAAAHAASSGRAVLVSTTHGQRHIVRGNYSAADLLSPPRTGAFAAASSGDAAAAARLLLAARGSAQPTLVHGPAGDSTLLERLDADLPAVWLFGAGHVGQALARILADLPVRLTWIDSRAASLPSSAPAGVCVRCEPDPVTALAEAPIGACFVVMTHSHPLDFQLCLEILQRDDFAWLGLIGSASKAARFRSRLRREGVEPRALERLVCPIGLGGIDSKWPTAIAVAVAAQLLQEISAAAGARAALRAPDSLPDFAVRAGASHECSAESCSSCGQTHPVSS